MIRDHGRPSTAHRSTPLVDVPCKRGAARRWGAAAFRRLVVLVALAITSAATIIAGDAVAPVHAQSVFDYVTFDGIDYIRWIEEPGRALAREDLGAEFATVECASVGDRHDCPYGTDAGAAFLPAGTPVYAVKGYRTDFRLAALASGRVLLYQAWRNARAKTGAQLYDIARRVSHVEVRRDDRTRAARMPPVRVTDPRDADALVDMIITAGIRAPRAAAAERQRYWITLWLTDGTTLGRPYFADSGELLGGVALPPEFRRIVERYLGD